MRLRYELSRLPRLLQLLSLVAVPLLAAPACGLVPSQGSCDTRPAEQACTDLLNNKNSQFRSTLAALCVGTYSDELCNHTGALGGCECDGCENGKSITWIFADPAKHFSTVDDAKAECAKEKRPYVAP